MKHHRLALAMLALAVTLARGSRVHAQAQPTKYTGIDLVVLIDQSGSMWGHPQYHPEANDAGGHRIARTQRLVEQLAEHTRGTPWVHRISVVDFGDEAKVALSNHVMRFDPKDPEKVERETSAMAAALITAKDWVNTNTPAAMKLGLEELQRMDAAEPLPDRLKVMLLVTDGRALLPGMRDQMPDLVRSAGQDVRDAGVGLYVVGINDADDYWNGGDGALWESIAGKGHARLAETASTRIPSVFHALFDEWLRLLGDLAPGGSTCVDHFTAPPYLAHLTFDVSMGQQGTSLTVTDPNGAPVPDTGGVLATGTNAKYELSNSPAGDYTFDKDPRRFAGITPVMRGPNLARVSPGASVDMVADTPIVYQMNDDHGKPLASVAGRPIDASFVIQAPNSKEEVVPATVSASGQVEGDWRPAQPGPHTIRVAGLVAMPDGTSYDIFSQSTGYDMAVEVSDKTPLWLQLVTPDPATRRATILPWAAQLPIDLRVVDSAGKAVPDLGGVARNPSAWIRIAMADANGIALGGALPLQVTSGGSLRAQLPVPLSWDLLRGGVPVYVRLAPDPAETADSHVLAGVDAGANAAGFVAAQGEDSLIGPISVQLPGWLIAALIAVPVLLILLLIAAAAVFLGRASWFSARIRRAAATSRCSCSTV